MSLPALAEFRGCGVIFGLVAREDDDARSDVDIVILIEPGSNRPLVRDRTQRIAASRTPNRRVTPVLFSIDGFQRECAQRPSFYAHSCTMKELWFLPGRVVEIRRILRESCNPHRLLGRNSNRNLRNEPSSYRSSVIWTGLKPVPTRTVTVVHPFTFSGDPEAIGRGRREYDWKRIFDSYARLEPSMRDQLRNMQNLRPYYEHVHDRHKLPADDQYVKEEAVESAIESVTAVARS